jgi:hypothetical protein
MSIDETTDSTQVLVPEEVTSPVATEAEPEPARPRRSNPRGGFGKEEEVAVEVKASTAVRIEDIELEDVAYEDIPAMLPHGFFVEGERLQEVKMHGFDPAVDEMLGALYSGQRAEIQKIMGAAFPKQIATIGGHTLDEIAKASSITVAQLIDQMPLGDALTCVIAGRERIVGEEIAIDDQCPECKTRAMDNPANGRFYHNTGTVRVGNLTDLSDRLVAEVQLKDGFVVHGVRCKRVHMRPVRLYELAKMPTLKRGKLDMAMVELQISAIPDCEKMNNVRGLLFNQKAYETMTGENAIADRKTLIDASQKLQRLGPAMSVANNCDNCGHEWQSALGWANLRNFWFTPASPVLER